MTKILSATLMFTLASICQRAMADVELVRDGAPIAKIYVAGPIAEQEAPEPAGKAKRKPAKTPSDPEVEARAQAVRELNYHLEKMSGAALEVVVTEKPGDVRGPAIVVGGLAVTLGAKPQKTSESQEGFRILTRDKLVLIGGQNDRAALLGTYELLRQLGCDWVMPGEIGEVIPRRATVRVPDRDESQAPDFLTRSLWYRGGSRINTPEDYAQFDQWLRRHKGGRLWSHPASGTGGHVWDAFIGRHKKEFEKDPTMLALRRASDGSMQRTGPQIEPSHPRVVELFVKDIKETYRRNIEAGQWTKDTPAGFGIGPADGLGYSMSPESLLTGSDRIDPIVGELDRTDDVILLGNRILEEVHKEYPGAYVGFYSYSTHADFPARYKPNPRIVQIFAPINFSRYHGLLDANSKTQAYYRDVVEHWGRLSREQGNLLFYRGYNWNLAENMLPYSKVRIWGEELPYYKKQGFVGLSVEATKAWTVNGPSDYVFMNLAWDTSQHWKDLLHRYCTSSFGAAAQPMERYFLRIIDTQHAAGQEAGSYHAMHLLYDRAWVDQSASDIEAALAAAKTNEDRTRVEYFGYGLDALKRYLDYHQATLRFDFPAAKAAFQAMHADWQKVYDIDTNLVAKEVPQYLNRFLAKFVEQGLRHSTGEYKIVYKIPDELPTLFDPNEVGHRLRYQSPAINDSAFVKTKTYSTTWDAQGLAGLRAGAVWYRVRFPLPADLKGKPIGLVLGGVEDEARVWINGELVGSGRGFSVPLLFDLTDGVRAGEENLLAIQVVRNSKANEIGLGGILRPSFLFTGPRLENKAPQSVELRRVLPGGELGELER